MDKLKKWEVTAILGLLMAFGLSGFFGFSNICADIRSETLRLHVVANSNTPEDQALKLYVRDCILAGTGEMFAGAQDKENAQIWAGENLEEIQKIAQAAVEEQGYAYTASVRLSNEYFATTHYESATMPAGRYDALRVELGDAEGANWWCVLYPPLCLPAAAGESGFEGVQGEVVQCDYEIRFAAVEFLERVREGLRTQSAGE